MNVAVALGARFQGIPGAVVCLVGLMAAPVAIVIGLGVVYDQYADYPPVHRAFVALSSAAAAFMLSNAWKIASPLRGRWLAVCVTACTFMAIAVLRLPLGVALPVLAIGSSLLLWRFRA
jgi:chromate transporter